LYKAIAYHVRLMDTGFGGALVAASKVDALAKRDAVASIAQDVIEQYKRSGYAGRILVVEVS
jgi:galactokinase